jgi:membrane protein DedA with SNARE-associated domain
MDSLLAPVIEFIEQNHKWAPIIMGLVAFGESLFIVGLIIPATPIFLAAGALIATGSLEVAPMLLYTMAGAVIGDIASYIIGRQSGRSILYSAWGKRHRKRAAKSRAFFRRYGALSVFIGRFFGPLRSTVPFMAGVMRMDNVRFQFANVGSAIIWAPMMLLPTWLAVKGTDLLGNG